MTSSSRRVIKNVEGPAVGAIEPYVPPVELMVSRREKKAEKAVFPRVDPDGNAVEEGVFTEDDPSFGEEELHTEELSLQDLAHQEAEQILEEARQEAAELIGNAKRTADEERRAARETGYRDGFAAGTQDGRAAGEKEVREEYDRQMLAFQEDMKRAFQSVERAKENCLRTYLDELKDCAIAIGEKVIQISLRSSGEVIRQMIISATEKLKKTAWVKIYIDKYDYDMMMQADSDIIDELSHLSDNIKFVVMDREESGDCIIEMPEEIVDVSVSTQIENIKDILENVRV